MQLQSDQFHFAPGLLAVAATDPQNGQRVLEIIDGELNRAAGGPAQTLRDLNRLELFRVDAIHRDSHALAARSSSWSSVSSG
jgi:hypothetical protein